MKRVFNNNTYEEESGSDDKQKNYVESNQTDRTEARKCIQKAQALFSEGQYDKAEHFLRKSLRICESDEAKSFLETVCNAKSQNNTNVKVKTEECNESVNKCLNVDMDAHNKCNKLSAKAETKGNLFNVQRFLSKAIQINPNEEARANLKRNQDLRAAQPSNIETVNSMLKSVSFTVDTKTGDEVDKTKQTKQQSEKTRQQINDQKSMAKNGSNFNTTEVLDKADNFKPTNDLENKTETVAECIEKAQKAFNEGKHNSALSLLTKAERIYPTTKAKELMKQIKEILLQNGENADPVQNKSEKGIVKKGSGVSTPQPKNEEVPRKQMTEIQRVLQAVDDYDILGKLTNRIQIVYMLHHNLA